MIPPQPVKALLAEATSLLNASGIDSPTLEAERLLEHVTGIPFLRRRLGMAPEPTAEAVTRFHELVQQRAQRIPLQHLLGTAPFLQLTLHVSRHVLVPRPGGRFIFGRLLGREAGKLHILPMEAGSRQQIVTDPAWIAKAVRLVRKL